MTQEELINEASKEVATKVEEEIIPTLIVLGNAIKEHKAEVLEAAIPFLEFYKEIIQVASSEVTTMYVDNIIAAIEKLEENGFTREEAIGLLKR